jgi:hypothetical protein
VSFAYERHKLPDVRPASSHTYLLDFALPNGVALEVKGYLTRDDRMKLLLVKKQHPDLDLRMIVSRGANKVEGLVLTVAEWCVKMGIPWAAKEVPREWIEERPRRTRVEALERFRK